MNELQRLNLVRKLRLGTHGRQAPLGLTPGESSFLERRRLHSPKRSFGHARCEAELRNE